MFDIVTAIWASKRSKAYTDEVVESIGRGFKYKGSVPTEADLPQTGNKLGDNYTTVDSGAEWVWTQVEGGTPFWLDLSIATEDTPTAGSKKALSSGGAYTTLQNYVSYSAQSKTDAEKLQARTNIGAGVPYTVTIDV